ncbi:sulfate adenylyltransferase subunit 1 [Micromonospora fluostatini]|uniref:sulfate adenylyltransferase subunit 1 n=1 Tax=Micromonospora sp. JCM 30529 TaxID=3421643 RepID=UPI003D1717D9
MSTDTITPGAGVPEPVQARPMDLLRFATAGSVDDGKSTLIGRLLYDTKSLFTDQLAAVEAVSAARGDEYTNLALLTDGLRAEREQGITIDVAYRYFATPRRKFIIADTPGHIQYTRNMVTGASTADLALILVDARKGLVEQSRRHAFLCSLLRVPHLVLCVNKMDLVDYDQAVFDRIADEFTAFAAKLDVPDLTVIPVSALKGDNIVTRSENMPWYEGPALLHHLERVHIASDRNLVDVRFPVQYVIRPQSTTVTDYRGYAGQVASGVLKPGDEVMVLPSGFTSRIAAVETADGPLDEAFPPMSVTVRLTDEIDISRGDMICRPHNAPTPSQDIEAMICWMDETRPLHIGGKYTIKHTTRTARTIIRSLQYRLDINTLHRDDTATHLTLNEIGRVRLRTTIPLLADEYRRNRTTGGFIIIDETTHRTVAAGMIIEAT